MRAERDQVLSFEVDEEAGLPLGFRDRLARENGWSRRHAARVYDEYRRFLWLAVSGERPVTPSDQVDQAWHLHLTYTRSYWDGLCGEVLGRPLHHGPTSGTTADDARYRAQYQATLDRYALEFGAPPPADVWPSVEERFRSADRWVRVDTADRFVVRRAPVVAAGAAAAAVLVATGASGGGALFALVLVGIVIAVVVFVVRAAAGLDGGGGGRRRRRGGGDAGGGGFFWFGDGGSSHDSGGHDGGGHGGWGGGDSGGGDSGGGGGGCGGGGCGS